MGELTHRTAAAAPQSVRTGVDGDVDAVNFGAQLTEFTDLGLPDPEARGGVVASGVVTEDRVRRRRSDQTYFRRAIAWSATRRDVTIQRMEQPMSPREDGRFRTSGPWSEEASVQRSGTGLAPVRRGDVPHAPRTSQEVAAGEETGEGPFVDAYRDLSMLPRPVRSSVLKRAGDPDHFYSLLVRHNQDEGLHRYSLQLLRANAREAVVVVASRIEGAGTWQVAQYTYDFTGPTHPDRAIPGPQPAPTRLGPAETRDGT